jgi:spore maturation protein CgeB
MNNLKENNRVYNDKKICFIICSNDEQQLQECLLYLSLLKVPEGYERELLVITDAKSMTSGYNEGMNASDAKYKIYLHQDSFIIYADFLEAMLKVFKKDKKIGMMGIIGAETLSKDGVMWHEDRCGNFYRLDSMIKDGLIGLEHLKRGVREVDVVDGFFIATQYDIPWREDLLDGWDFYDVSQCMEFKRAGYKIVVPGQKEVWVNHVCGAPSFWTYNKYRKIVLEEYPEIKEKRPERLRILFLHSKQIVLIGLPYTLNELGHSIFIPEGTVELNGRHECDVEYVEELLEEGHYDLVVTYDFSPGTAEACTNMGVKYYSWVYDSPLMELYDEQALADNCYISVFDKKQMERLEERGFKHMFYLPLASEVDAFGAVSIKKRDEKKYAADVSFVGRLYDNRGYDELFGEGDEKLKEEADKLVSSLDCVWDGKTNLFGKASDELIEHIVSKAPSANWEAWKIDKRYWAESMMLVRRCNEVERIKILNYLGERYNVVLYSDDSEKKMLKNITIKPWLDYGQEMPKAFYLSKINLNITSRSIESGVPQRVWDILSVGGFCLTNYQPELEDYFEIGKDLDVYHNLEELDEKIDYYLKHDEERVRIAINGYKKMRKYHTTTERLKKALAYIYE